MYGCLILCTIQLYEHPFPPISLDNQGSTAWQNKLVFHLNFIYIFIYFGILVNFETP